ncbi:hypothetical protein JCM17823_06310 [Halorubrum gandharaense]
MPVDLARLDRAVLVNGVVDDPLIQSERVEALLFDLGASILGGIQRMSQAANVQADIRSARRYNRNYRRWLQLRSRREALTDERQRLVSRYEALDPANVTGTLKASVIAILLAIVVPSLAYLLRVLGLAPEIGPAGVRSIAVFVAWVFGLGYVFLHLYREITEVSDELPKRPVDDDATDASDENQTA